MSGIEGERPADGSEGPSAAAATSANAGAGSYVLFGYLGGRNLGDDAMLEGFLHTADSDAEFIILCRETAAVSLISNRRVVLQKASLSSALKAMLRADGVIRVGGTSFHDEYVGAAARGMVSKYVRLAGLFLFPRLLGKRVAAIGIGAGRIDKASTRLLARIAMGACQVIVARDHESTVALRRLTNPRKVIEGVDLALLMPRASAAEDARPVLGVSVLDLSPYLEGDVGPRFWADLVDHWIERHDPAEIRIFSFKDNENESDMPVARALAEHISGRGLATKIMTHRDGLRAVRDAIGGCSLFLASRYHSAVLAAAANVPIVIVPYNEKLRMFAADIGAPSDATIEIVDWRDRGEIRPAEPFRANLESAEIEGRLSALKHAVQQAIRH